ncbi:MAG: agmatinase [Gaiellales bacterium]|nr:agmatinase [Gaiellales bacterium]
MYEPVDALQSPRYSGPRTFGRLPHVETTDGVDVALFGIPWDSGTSFRPGARFGPEAVRSASALLRPYNPAQDVMVFGGLSCVDYGDAPTVPGYIEDTLARIQAYAEVIHRGAAIPLGIGGDHSVTLAELRAAAAVHGPLGLVHLDAHHDVWDSYFGRPYNHGTVFKRACEEGLLEPARCVQAGMRGSLYGPEDYQVSRDLGMTILPWLELRELGPAAYGDLVRDHAGAGPVFFTFDVDFLDPAYCPGTGTPEVGGPTSAEALAYVRALHGLDFCALDVVEVAPQYDGPGQITALLAANVAYEMLSLVARSRP